MHNVYSIFPYSVPNIVQAGKLGINELMVKAIRTHIDNAKICEHGCDILSNLSLDGKTTIIKEINVTTKNDQMTIKLEQEMRGQ